MSRKAMLVVMVVVVVCLACLLPAAFATRWHIDGQGFPPGTLTKDVPPDYDEVYSPRGYPTGYHARNMAEQTNRLRELFPGIGDADEKLAEKPLPAGAEGWFAIPRWEKIAPTYEEAVEKVLGKIKQTRGLCDDREGQRVLGVDSEGKRTFFDKSPFQHLRRTSRTEKMFQKLGDQQKNHDILVVPAQFGLRHRGRSVERVRGVFAPDEFGLGVFEIGCMLLTHPGRIDDSDELLDILCVGDESQRWWTDPLCGRHYKAFCCVPALGDNPDDDPVVDPPVDTCYTVVDDLGSGTSYHGAATGFLP